VGNKQREAERSGKITAKSTSRNGALSATDMIKTERETVLGYESELLKKREREGERKTCCGMLSVACCKTHGHTLQQDEKSTDKTTVLSQLLLLKET